MWAEKSSGFSQSAHLMNTLKGYYLGCPIWGNKGWVGELFTRDAKPKDFLKQYTTVFNTVEGNTTFYGLPTEATIARWHQDVPDGFRFALKFSQAISHDKRLMHADPDTALFLEMMDALSDRTGPAFLQLPSSFGPSDLPVLDSYLAALPKTHSYAVEVRHEIFYAQAEAALDMVLRKHGVDRIVFDTGGLHAANTGTLREREAQRKKPNMPVRFTATGPHPFVRFIGHPEVEKISRALKNGPRSWQHGYEKGARRISFSTRPTTFMRLVWPDIFIPCSQHTSTRANSRPGLPNSKILNRSR